MTGLADNPHAVRGRAPLRTPGLIDPKALGVPTISGTVLHLKPTYGLWTDSGKTTKPSDGDPIYWWDDYSEAGNHMSQPTEANRPLLQENISGSHDAVEFDGSDDYLTIAKALCGKDNLTLFLVVYLSSPSERGAFFGVGTSADGWKVGVGDASRFEYYGNKLVILLDGVAWKPTGDDIGMGTHLITLRFTSGTFYWWIDGVAGGSGSGATKTPSAVTYIGTGAYSNRYYTDHLYELVLSSESISDSERTNMETYLMRKYGI